jgi:3alpha(or 20beta)-hydroxysteroid dehydrogenase
VRGEAGRAGVAPRLDGKVIIVTGAAQGMGAGEAELCVANGAHVVLVDRTATALERLAESLGHRTSMHILDVSDEDGWVRVIADIERSLGRLDGLVNNAGISGPSARIVNTETAEFLRTVEVNQMGVFLGMKHAAALMRDSGGGSIVNVSSVTALVGAPGTAAYSATKWAVRGMTRVAALELGRDRIRVNTVLPGGIETPMLLDGRDDVHEVFPWERLPAGRPGTTEDVAHLVVFLLSDESAYCTGAEFVIDGGMTAGPALPHRR